VDNKGRHNLVANFRGTLVNHAGNMGTPRQEIKTPRSGLRDIQKLDADSKSLSEEDSRAETAQAR